MTVSDRISGVQILNTPMQSNDAEADTIRGYLIALLTAVWDDGAEFSGKRPFGNSGWEHDLYEALVRAGRIEGTFDEDGWLEDADTEKGRELVAQAIQALGVTDAASEGKPTP